MRLALFASLLFVLALPPSALFSAIGTIDVKPAATLLFPYFEVDLDNVNGRTTVVTIQAATPTATLAHVTLWTVLGIPIYAFDFYLTGYDIQAINLRDVFNGDLPRTADDALDPADTISNQGQFSQDINYPGATGPCGPSWDYRVAAGDLADLRAAHTGQAIPSSGSYAGRNLGDNVARGFLTVDVVQHCSPTLPSDPGYFAGMTHTGNWLFGEYLLIDPENNFLKSEVAVHLEASEALLGHRTFYGRLPGAAGGIDRREPLPSTWALGTLTDSLVVPETSIMVWRDPGPGAPIAPFVGPALPAPFPLPAVAAKAFDDESRVAPMATTAAPYAVTSSRLVPDLFNPGTKLGWAFLDLNVGLAPADVRQSWVTVARSWEGRFATATSGVVLDPPSPSLELLEATCPEGTIEIAALGWNRPVLMVRAPSGATVHITYRLRLIDSAPRDVTAETSVGSFAGPPAGSIQTANFAPGESSTSTLWGTHEFVVSGVWGATVNFYVPGGSAEQSLQFEFMYLGEI